MTENIILGIDPSLTATGWGIIEYHDGKMRYIQSGVIKTNASDQIHKRVGKACTSLRAVCIKYGIKVMSIEETFVNNNSSSSLKLAYLRGAIMALAFDMDMLYFEYLPNTVKKTVTGSGHCQKEQIQFMLKYLLVDSLPDDLSLDQTDALGIAYTCFINNQSLFK